MKKILIPALIIALATLVALPVIAQATTSPKTQQKSQVQKLYVCTMCDYASNKPGKCATCGMNLQEVNKADVSYTCDMCGVKSDNPGKCPKCGMTMKMKVAEPKAATKKP